VPRIKYKEAARIEVKRGRPSLGIKPHKSDLIRLYKKEGKSIRAIAEELRCTKDMVYRALQENAIQRRPRIRESRLYQYDVSQLKEAVRGKGVRGLARELYVDPSTLLYHMKKIGLK
jgi:hypothetical protein